MDVLMSGRFFMRGQLGSILDDMIQFPVVSAFVLSYCQSYYFTIKYLRQNKLPVNL